MKRLFVTFGILLVGTFALNAQELEAKVIGGAQIEFTKEVHNYGTMKQYGDASCVFEFKNTGTEPLIISNCKGSCGCTVPQCPKQPIKPGETGLIKVKYDSKRVGPINKSVTVTSNATNTPNKVIRIKGKIEPAPKEGTLPIKEKSSAPVEKQ